MTTFNGTDDSDRILRNSVSAGVEMLPDPVAGTQTGEQNLIFGYGGDDVLEAGDGFSDEFYTDGDAVFGGDGNDTLYGGKGYDSLHGEDGDDVIWGGSHAGYFDYYDGGAGNDVIHAADNTGNSIAGGAGADRMYGGRYDDWFYVDDAGDKVIERAGGGDDTVYSTIATIKLAANVENLFSDLWYDDVHATGNRLGNYIATQDGNDTVHGGGGNDYIETGAGADVVRGGAGDDILFAFHGTDRLYGGAGSDMLIGGFDADLLFGGKGDDVFTFEGSWDSTPSRRDMIGCADGVAFEGAGKAGGDLIDLRGLDADLTTPDFDFFVFGGTGKGHLSLVNRGSDTLVRGNVDDDGGFEFECLIRDGEVKASAYTAADFLLVWE